MTQELTTQNIIREGILELEDTLKNIDGAMIGDNPFCPLTHNFTDGIYTREIRIPAGTMLTGKIHKHEHPNVLLSGEVLMVTEHGGKEHVIGPKLMFSKPGTKRALYAITDLHWITFHHNPGNTQDLEKLENNIIAPTYEDFERSKKIGLKQKVKNLINKIL